ncbi:MAG: TIGR03088 family PEP-CTERM/XrtA system glycosyltransferase [Thiohalorhabdus sp.]|uniref:TIGR03088 family PEP-CTERM/XrtA system glycosyltransferase n=1 Tax=Thiohalorhabdus sp. TaxID=3094134 RepID=UPI002FC2F7BD
MNGPATPPPLVVHVVHALRVGGMENGLVNLINRTPSDRLRHAVVCLTDYDRFAERIEDPDVPVIALHKREGKDPALYGRLWRTLRRLCPDLVHTRNLAALEAQLPAALAGVPRRVHGEHGRDMADLAGASRKYRWLRRGLRPLIHQYVPLSRDLEAYLRDAIGVAPERITRITNGVDVERFRPDPQAHGRLCSDLGWEPDTRVIGWVGRMEPVKNPLGLVNAFARLVERRPAWRERLGLALVGDGSQALEAAQALADAGLSDRAWLPGSRDDVANLLPAFDLFALPSLAEGISNTVLEALASGVPVVATRVGGNAELVTPGETGALVPPEDPEALAAALAAYLDGPERLPREAETARARAVERFSIDAMVTAYLDLYDRLLQRASADAAASRGGVA